ncbi:MAG: transketolase [Thermodesulfobacteriota bacterium]
MSAGTARPASPSAPDYAALRRIARTMREHILEMIAAAGSGHPGGSLSAVEIVAALYFHKLRWKKNDPSWAERDRFVISKGHGVPVVYAALAVAGEIPVAELSTLRRLGSRLQGHPDHAGFPWMEAATGSLGQGLSIALGMALASRLDGAPYRVYALLGDGECQAGQVWEAAMCAGKYGVHELTAIVDYNKVQLDGLVKDILDLEPLRAKWESFGWNVLEIDGNDVEQVVPALDRATETRGKPTVIVAHTTKGKGVSFMEGTHKWHGVAPNAEELARALAEVRAGAVQGG